MGETTEQISIYSQAMEKSDLSPQAALFLPDLNRDALESPHFVLQARQKPLPRPAQSRLKPALSDKNP
jgi:hypothetical protein